MPRSQSLFKASGSGGTHKGASSYNCGEPSSHPTVGGLRVLLLRRAAGVRPWLQKDTGGDAATTIRHVYEPPERCLR